MKKFLFWIADLFHIDLSVERIVIKEVIKEVPKEVIKKIVVTKEVPVEIEKKIEVPIYKDRNIALADYVSGDLIVKGNLIVEGTLDVEGEITCFKINNSLKNK